MNEPTILLLAAGRSSRMAGRAAKAGVPVRVVLGPGQDARRAALEGLAVAIVEAEGEDGMAASIRAGVAGLEGPVLLVLADMPEITANDLYLMVTLAARAPGAILRAASAAGRPGHPVLFPADLLPDLARLSGDAGAKALLEREAGRLHLLPLAGERALVDLDTPEDWAAWRARQP